MIICANRDEFHARPTKTMHFWQGNKVLAGKDLVAGGTWLGLNSKGDFAALTNHREGYQSNITKKSRGELVINALTTPNSNQLVSSADNYHGFNLIFGPLNQLSCFNSISKKTQRLTDGFHSICNGAMDDIWPKMALGQSQLETYIKNNQTIDPEQLFLLMKNKQQAESSQLPKTGIPIEKEQLLSSIFIKSPDYGTRTTTLIVQDKQHKIAVHNRDYLPSGHRSQQQSFTL